MSCYHPDTELKIGYHTLNIIIITIKQHNLVIRTKDKRPFANVSTTFLERVGEY